MAFIIAVCSDVKMAPLAFAAYVAFFMFSRNNSPFALKRARLANYCADLFVDF